MAGTVPGGPGNRLATDLQPPGQPGVDPPGGVDDVVSGRASAAVPRSTGAGGVHDGGGPPYGRAGGPTTATGGRRTASTSSSVPISSRNTPVPRTPQANPPSAGTVA